MKPLFLALLLSLPAAAQTPRQAIAAVLTAQTAAWNRGDLPGFMAGYWRSDSLVFIGKSGLTYGWQPTLDRYQRTYGQSSAQMGQLDFAGLRITPLGADVAQVVGRWHLTLPAGAPGPDPRGQFLLIFRRLGGRWVIVADHSS